MNLKKLTLLRVWGFKVTTDWLALAVPLIVSIHLFMTDPYSCIAMYVAYLSVVLVHEFGHAAVAKYFKSKVYEINITWFGGLCKADSSRFSEKQFAIFAAGGVLAQLFVIVLVIPLLFIKSIMALPFIGPLIWFLTKWNALLALINLIPIHPFDGKIIFDYFKKHRT